MDWEDELNKSDCHIKKYFLKRREKQQSERCMQACRLAGSAAWILSQKDTYPWNGRAQAGGDGAARQTLFPLTGPGLRSRLHKTAL